MFSTMGRTFLRQKAIAMLVCVCFIIYFPGRFIIVETQKGGFFRSSLMDIGLTETFKKAAVPTRPVRRVFDVSCSAILNNNKTEIHKAVNITSATQFQRKGISDAQYIELTKNCENFRQTRGYYGYRVSNEEKDFPIAFSILLYKDVEQAERLLRAIYRPQNIYCVHVDGDSAPEVHSAIDGITNCLSNVFVVSSKEFVVYAGYSRLQADLNCMADLLNTGNRWKYFINLPSQQFPIKTNAEIVKILTAYNGSNDIEGITGDRRLIQRVEWRYHYKYDKNKLKPHIMRTNQKKGDIPYNMAIVKGSAYGIFSRKFVEFIINDKIARALLDFFRDVLSPDEYYWATLNHNPHIGAPGSYKGKPDKKPWLATFALWRGTCFGKFVRHVCVFGVGDLSSLVQRKELFVNKFYLDYQPLALDCIEEWYLNRSLSDTESKLNMTYYRSLPFVKKL